MLKLAIKAMAIPELKEEATGAALVIAQKIGSNEEATTLLSKAGLERVKLEIVKAEYGGESIKKDVTALLQKLAGDLPLLTLPGKGGYNGNFGGDPLPGSVKVLKVQYKINSKAGEATFAEDALIVLPMPK